MVKSIDKIIQYSILESRLIFSVDKASSTLYNETDNKFLLKLEEDSNSIAAKTQSYFSSYNTTCFKYRTAFLR